MRMVAGTLALVVSLFPRVQAQPGNQDLVWARASNYLASCDLGASLAFQGAPALPAGSWGIAVDGQRNVWVTDYVPGSNTVSKLDPAGNLIGTYVAGPPVGAGESSVGPIAIDAQGFVYVGDPRDNVPGSVTKLDAYGVNVGSFPVQGNSVRSLAIDPNGDVWAMFYWGTSGHVEKRTPAGSLLFAIAAPGSTANSIYIDERGLVYVSHYPSPTQVAIYDLAGVQVGSRTSAVGHHFRALAVSHDGRVWASPGNEFEVFSPAGVSLGSINGGGGYITAIHFDGRGNAWMSSLLNRLRKFDASLAFAGQFIAGPVGGSLFTLNIGDATGMVRARTVDPFGDLDGDGFPNYAEVVAGESPCDPASVPATVAFNTPPAIGTTCALSITATGDGALPYFMPWSLNPATFTLSAVTANDRRRFPISPLDAANPLLIDPIWAMSTGASPFSSLIFPATFGTLSAQGSATVAVNIPNLPALIGLQIHAAFASLDAAKPSGIRTISSRITATFQ